MDLKGRTEDIPELDHEYLEETIVSPTCTTEGYTEHKCIHCGEVVKDTYVPALGHDMTEVPYLAPTCTEPGRNRYYHCSRCNLDFRNESATDEMGDDEKIINPLGHDFPSVWRWDDSFDEDMHFRVCLREECGTMETGVHAYDQKVTEGHIAEESTCQHPNRYYWSCVCGKNGSEIFTADDKLGEHSYTKYVPVDYQYHQTVCEWCDAILPDSEESHVFNGTICSKCEYEVITGSGGFTPIITDKRPLAHLEYKKEGSGYVFTLINDREEYPPANIRWYLDDKLQEETGWSFVFDAPYPMTYKVMCIYSNDNGKGSETIVVNGG